MTGALRHVLRALEARLEPDVELVLTSNRVRMASVRPRPGRRELRVARRLLEELGADAVEPLADFASRRSDGRALRELVRAMPAPAPAPRRRVVLRPTGRVHALVPILREEALEHLGAVPDVGITWGPRRAVRRHQRSVRLGSYAARDRVVRIHPLLDHASVPRWFVGFVVFHELLHDQLRDERGPGRRVHSRRFRALEAAHPRCADAAAWQEANLGRLLRAQATRR